MELLKPWWCSESLQSVHRCILIQQKNLTVHNCLERFLQVPICTLEVLVIIAAPKRAVIHQLQSDMNRYTVIFGYDIPIFVYVVENSLSEKIISSSVYILAQYAC